MPGKSSRKGFSEVLLKSLTDERGSIYLEYGLVAGIFLLTGLSFLTPGFAVWDILGFDMNFRYLIMKLPIF